MNNTNCPRCRNSKPPSAFTIETGKRKKCDECLEGIDEAERLRDAENSRTFDCSRRSSASESMGTKKEDKEACRVRNGIADKLEAIAFEKEWGDLDHINL